MFSCVFLIILLLIFVPKIALDNWAVKDEKKRQKRHSELSKEIYQKALYFRDNCTIPNEEEFKIWRKIKNDAGLKNELLSYIKNEIGDYNYSTGVLALVYLVKNKIMLVPYDFASPGIHTFPTRWEEYRLLERNVFKWYDNAMRKNGYPYKLMFVSDEDHRKYRNGTWVQENPPIDNGVYYFEPARKITRCPTACTMEVLDMKFKEIQSHRNIDTTIPL